MLEPWNRSSGFKCVWRKVWLHNQSHFWSIVTFVESAKVEELAPGEMKLVEVGEERFVLFNIDGEFYAISDVCTHRQCSLSEGSLDGDVLECLCHGSQFNVRTGAVENPPARTPVPSYSVRIEGDAVCIGPVQA